MNITALIAASLGSIFGVGIRMATIHYCTITLLTIQLPVASIMVNAIGSCIAGLLIKQLPCQDSAYAFAIIGFCGSMTTMSTCALESLFLCTSGNYFAGITNAFVNMSLSIGSAALGVSISSYLAQLHT